MIFDKSKLKMAAILIAAINFLGAASPVFAVEVVSTASAQSAAVKTALEGLEDNSGKLSARDKLKGVLDLLMAQVEDLANSLSSLKGLDEVQADQRDQYLDFLSDAVKYLTALQIDAETADVKFIAEELQNWREETFSPEIKNIVDFVLVFQVKSVLKTAETRYLKIRSDVGRLEDLKILKDTRARNLLAEVRALLTSAADLRNQAENLLVSQNDNDDQIRKLLNDSIAKVRLAYKKFIEISLLVKEALK